MYIYIIHYFIIFILYYLAKDSNDKTNNDNGNNIGMSSVQLMYLWCKHKGLGTTGRDLSVLEVYKL